MKTATREEEKMPEDTLVEGGTGTNSLEPVQPDSMPERFESGTVALPAIMGMSAGIDYVNRIGMNKLYEHEMSLCRFLYRELAKIDRIELYTPEPLYGKYVPVLSFNVFGRDSSEIAQLLSDKGIAVRGGLHCAPSAHRQAGTLEKGMVRVSVASFNTQADIKSLVAAVKSILK